jgi:hypothetical protein
VPDTSAPGWKLITNADGCQEWVPPANVPIVVCGAAPDGGNEPDARDAARDVATDTASDVATDAPADAPSDAQPE